MNNNLGELYIHGLTKPLRLSLEDALGKAAVSSKPGPGQGRFNDPATVAAVVTVTMGLISSLAIWISRRVENTNEELEVTVRRPDGTEKHLRFSKSSNKTETEKDVLQQLKAIFVNDTSALSEGQANAKRLQ